MHTEGSSKFRIYFRQNRNTAQLLHLGDDARLAQSNFNFNYPLAIYLHGFSESATGEKQSSQELKDGEWRRRRFAPPERQNPEYSSLQLFCDGATIMSFLWTGVR